MEEGATCPPEETNELFAAATVEDAGAEEVVLLDFDILSGRWEGVGLGSCFRFFEDGEAWEGMCMVRRGASPRARVVLWERG